ncbi:hypothetical protein BDZ45DRAFT_696539 [Acephala macrosclerotiorum]|nr:hypothetical protein BDZ45DRAFT_696539 [Acephala macrosclerotiorum]
MKLLSRSTSEDYYKAPTHPPPRNFRASPETQLSQEDDLHTGQGAADEYELVGPALEIFHIDEGEREKQEVEQEEDEDNDEDEGPQQEVNDIVAAVTVEIINGARSDRYNDDELNNTDLDDDKNLRLKD